MCSKYSQQKTNLGFVFILMAAFFFLLPSFNITKADYSGIGAGSEANPFQITTCSQLQEMNNSLTSSYLLTGDIDCTETTGWNSGDGFIPIGNEPEGFSGSFDGQGFSITGLYIDSDTEDYVGLFGVFLQGAIVKNVALIDVDIRGIYSAGGLIGYAYPEATITNLSVNGTITGEDMAGGLIGYAQHNAIISQVQTSGEVIGSWAVGGLVGYLEKDSQISNCYSQSNTTGPDSDGAVGGLIGSAETGLTITNCYATGNITGMDSGGLIGFAEPNINTVNSYWDKQTTGLITSSGTADSYGKTTFEMQTQLTFFEWDFDTVWIMNSGEYPQLQYFTPESITPSNSPTPTIASTSSPTTNHNTNTTDTSLNKNSRCSDPQPVSAPELFQINTTGVSAKLFFTPITNTNNYYISFSTSANAEEHGTGIINLSREGVQNYTIGLLKPNTIYYFKVRGQNGCMPGNWSNIMKIKTDSGSYYKNQVTQFLANIIQVYNQSQETVLNNLTPTTSLKISPTPKKQPSVPKNNIVITQDSHLNLWQKITKWLSR